MTDPLIKPFKKFFKTLLKPRFPRHKRLRVPIPNETQSNRPLPLLPAEIWRLIVREATSMAPDPLDTTKGVSFLESEQCRLGDYQVSMRIKRNLSMVNSVWNQLTQDVLYEFVWISRSSQAKALALTLSYQDGVNFGGSFSGQYIRRLHIQTPTLDRCCPADLRTILDYSPNLVVYSDYRSVRRTLYNKVCDRTSPQQLFSALAHPNNSLRRLSWTNYDSDISFHLHMTPMLKTTAANLEYLELTFCSPHFPSLFGDNSFSIATLPSSSIHIALPALRSLKVTLDNTTFAVLATWNMPALTNLSVVSADFSYASSGFSHFFRKHGPKILQLELGHSSSLIEEHYLTAPPMASPPTPLTEFCPNMCEFICSADAEWDWQHPDWIAPHILLPHHPRVQFLGIRDMDKRLLADAAAASDDAALFPLLTQISSLLNKDAFPSLRYIRDLSWQSDVMRREPELRVVRFWGKVLERCRAREVWLEDCRGVNVTMGDLKRAQMNKASYMMV